MTKSEYEEWCRANSTAQERLYVNDMEWMFCTMADGWIAVFEVDGGEYVPRIQAIDRAAAKTYVSFIEPIRVPVREI